MAPADIDETADVTHDFAKGVGSLPGGGEGADASRAVSADGSIFGLLAESVGLPNFSQNFFEEESDVGVPQGIVFNAAIVFAARNAFAAFSPMSGIDEDANGHRHAALVNQIVEHHIRPPIPICPEEILSVLKDHKRRRTVFVVLGRDVNPVVSNGSRIEGALVPGELGDRTLRNPSLFEGVGMLWIGFRSLR